MHATFLQFAIWWFGAITLTSVAAAMYRRGLYRELPIFFGYTIFHASQSWLAMLAFRSSYRTYFYFYWTSEVIDALLTLIVMQEIFGSVFRPYESLRSAGMRIFRWSLLGLVAVAIVAASGPSRGRWDGLVYALMVVQRSTLFIQGGLILFLLLFSRLFGLSWRNFVFGVSLGFGVMAGISGIASAIQTYSGTSANQLYGNMIAGGFVLSILIWFSYAVAPKTEHSEMASSVDRSRLNDWNQALGELLHR